MAMAMAMAREPKDERNAKQVVRQQQLRKTAKAKRKPSRDDVARVALWRFIHQTWKTHTEARKMLDEMRDSIVGDLMEQGFDQRESEARFEELAESVGTTSNRSGSNVTLKSQRQTPRIDQDVSVILHRQKMVPWKDMFGGLAFPDLVVFLIF